MEDSTKKTGTIRAEKLVKDYGSNRVVDGVSVELNAGEIVGMLGPNGAGKTTSFRMIIGFTQPNSGKVYCNDQEITRMPLHKRARLGISYLPQQTSVFRKMTVRENLMAVLQARGVSKKEIRPRVSEMVEELGIGYIERRTAEKLSGGEMRRVEIARALMTDPTFILLDEPFTGIDPPTVEDLQEIIQKLKQKGLGVLITDHNVRETLTIVDRSYMMYDGHVIVSGTMDEVFANEQIREKYLTRSIMEDLSRKTPAKAEAGAVDDGDA